MVKTMDNKSVYLDNNATTALAQEVLEAMLPYLREQFYNPSSSYPEAKGPRDAIEAARESVARLLGAGAKSEILFTSGATEANNAALWGVLRANPDRRHIVTTQVEHPAVLEVVKELERNGYRVTRLGVDRDGTLDKVELLQAIEKDTAIVSIMHGNNETGVIFPIAELSRIVKAVDSKIVFHTDATQTVGKIPLNLTKGLPDVDILTLSAHKLHGPKGTGAMFVRRGVRWRPWLIGGHQERSRRAGTENVAGIVGLGVAARLAMHNFVQETRLKLLRDKLEAAILEAIPNVFVNGQNAERLPNTTSFAFEYVEGESILLALSDAGICASSGSACTSGSLDPSHVLKAMHIPFSAAHGSLRISTSRYTTEAEVQRLIDVLPGIISSLRRISPYWDNETNAPRADVDVFVQEKYR